MATTEEPWHAAFPKPVSLPAFISREETLALFDTQVPGRDFILVDTRRTDFEVCPPSFHPHLTVPLVNERGEKQGGAIENSVNLPAQSFYTVREAVYDLMHASGVKTVISYCGIPPPSYPYACPE